MSITSIETLTCARGTQMRLNGCVWGAIKLRLRRTTSVETRYARGAQKMRLRSITSANNINAWGHKMTPEAHYMSK